VKYSLDGNDRSVVEALIEEKVLNAQHRLILRLRFCDALTYQEIADREDVIVSSRRQVGKIIADYAPRLKELLNVNTGQ
jgi:DNA-directed RNA polymerase specialized sigma subunit